MVFLRPTIIVDSAASSEISAEKYNYIKARQALSSQETKLIDLTEPKD